jgi:glycosyltransferase involved in cell wall biosynthesis
MMSADAVGGVWPYALTLAEMLSGSAEIHLAVMGPPPSGAQRAAAARIPNLHLHVGAFELEWMPEAERDLPRSEEWLVHVAEACRPDVVHLNGYAHAAATWPAPVVVVAHSCVLSWWQAVHGCAAPSTWRGYQERVAAGLARASRVVAPTQAMLQALVQHYGVALDGVVIRNGCVLHRYDQPVVEKEAFVLSAGRLWDDGKNLVTLDKAAGRLSVPVYVAGDRRHPDGAEVQPQSAHALGALPPGRLAEWMARAAVYAAPARYEPFGLSILEAAGSGCALVLGDIPSLRELWDDTALFVPPNDADAVADAIGRLVGDRALRARQGAAAKERSRHFSAAHMGWRYLQLYRELIADRDASLGLRAAG